MKSILSLPQPILIVGMGITGEATQDFLLAAGIAKNQILTLDEKAPAQFSSFTDLSNIAIGTLIISPGVPLKRIEVQELVTRAQLLTSEMSLVSSVLEDEICIGITGSLGKSTTTSALGAALESIDPHCFIGGNLGLAFAEYGKRKLLKKTKKARFVVLELSSYHLENSQDLSLHTSAITYLSPNHLERYSSLKEYYDTKLNIFSKTKNKVVLNTAGGDLKSYIQTSGLKDSSQIVWSATSFHDYASAQLIGSHNKENLSVVHSILKSLETLNIITPDQLALALKAALAFKGLPHRLENCGTKNGITYINDSKATALDSVITAIQASTEQLRNPESKLHLLIGGKDKNLPWSTIQNVLSQKNILIYLFGASRNIIASQISQPDSNFNQLKMAFDAAVKNSQAGDVILLSPGGTSLDEFKNFEDRGQKFKSYIQ